MNLICVMDVETNGLIKAGNSLQPNLRNLHLFPRIVQFSWGIYDQNGLCQEMHDFLIKPDGWVMNESDQIHGINIDKADKEGVPIKEALIAYKNSLEKCSKLVCHNLNFDLRVVLSEFIRSNLEINTVPTYCTMVESTNLCRRPPYKNGRWKWPSLAELYATCFQEKIDNQHNSYYDVINCAKCYFELLKINNQT